MKVAVTRFRVRHRNTFYELPEGEFVVGRAPGCQLILDDPRVSRRHTRFVAEGSRVTVEDLQSRNGTLVNGVQLKGPMVLADHDVVTIGSQEIRVMAARSAEVMPPMNALAATAPDLASMVDFEDVTQIGGPAAITTQLDKAVLGARYDEAERLLKQLFNELVVGGPTVRMRNPMVFERVARAVMTFTAATGRGAWLDQIFALYHRGGLVMNAALLDEVHTHLRALNAPMPSQLRDYVEWLRKEADRLGPAERFALQRAEGVMRALNTTTT